MFRSTPFSTLVYGDGGLVVLDGPVHGAKTWPNVHRGRRFQSLSLEEDPLFFSDGSFLRFDIPREISFVTSLLS